MLLRRGCVRSRRPTSYDGNISDRLSNLVVAAVVSLALVASVSHAVAAETNGLSGEVTFVLTPAPGSDIEALAARLTADGIEVDGILHEIERLIVSTERGVDELTSLPGVATVRTSIGLAVSLSDSTRVVEADIAADVGFSGAGSVVVVIDSGIDTSHPALAGAVVHEACFLFGTGGVCPGSGAPSSIGPGSAAPCVYSALSCAHGTHVAGIVASRDATRPGVAPGASIISIRVAAENGLITSAGVLAALDHVASQASSHNIVAVNLSLGSNVANCTDPDITAVLGVLADLDIVVVAASGNEPGNEILYPACLPGVVAVGSAEVNGGARVVSDFTQYEGDLAFVAPGRSIESTVPTAQDPTGFYPLTGTSMAAPHLAGSLAVLAEAHPSWSAERLVGLLAATGAPVSRLDTGEVVGRYAEPRLAAAVDFIAFVDTGSPFSTLAIDWAKATGVSQGIGEGAFGPTRSMTRAEVATLIWRLFGSPVSGAPAPFADVPIDSFYANAVAWLYEQDITSGTTATEFSPDALVNRAQLATFLWRAVGSPDGAPPNFSDVPAGQYFTDAVGWMVRWEITTGTSSSAFSPTAIITREQAITFLWRLANTRDAWGGDDVPAWVLS